MAVVSAVSANGCASVGSLDGVVLPSFDGGAGDDGPGSGVLPPGADAASACRPGDVATYQPAAYHSATAAWQTICSPELMGGFYVACLGTLATTATCAAFKADPAGGLCAACIVTPDSASHYGPLVDHGAFLSVNVAGCIELTDPGALPCAKAVQALGGCELAACEANCPVQDVASLAGYDQCSDQADQGGCQTYTQLSGCVADEADAGLVAACLSPSFADFYNAVVPIFCGAPQVDGAVPPFDASEEGSAATPEDASVGDADARAPGDGGPQGDARGNGGDGGFNPPPGGHDSGGGGSPPGPRDASSE